MNMVFPIRPCSNPAGHKWKSTDKTVRVGNRQHEVKVCEHCGQTDPPSGDVNTATTPPMITPGGPGPLGT